MKNISRILIAALFHLTVLSYAQIDTITWQHCFTTDSIAAKAYCIENFNNGFLVGIHLQEDGEGITNYHGGSDAWFLHLDSLGNIIWERCYGGTSWDQPLKVVPIGDNYYYLVILSSSIDGDVLCENHGESDVWVVKINTSGEIIWQNCYGGPDFERPRDAILTDDGGLLVMTRIYDKGGDISTFYGGYDNWICKIDSVGKLEWETTVGSPGRDNGLRLLLTSGGTYLALCGVNDNGGMSECEIIGDPFSGLDLWLVELDKDGNVIRQDCYGGSLDDLGWDLVEVDDGYVILAKTESYDFDVSHSNGLTDFWILKINHEREIVWENSLGGSNYEFPVYLTETQDGGFILIGDTYSNNHDVSGNNSNPGMSDIWVVKTNSLGELVWQKCFGDLGDEWFWARNTVAKVNDHNFTMAPITGANRFVESCFDVPGYGNWVLNVKDCSKFQPSVPSLPIGIDTLCVNTDSITTYSTIHAANAWYYQWELLPVEAGTITQDSVTTTVHWNPVYEGTASLKVSSYNDCGESQWSDSLDIFTYICLGTGENVGELPSFVVYPNPVRGELKIESRKRKVGLDINIEVVDVLGRIVYNSKILNNGNTISINTSNWQKGLYFVRVMEDGNSLGLRKVVVE